MFKSLHLKRTRRQLLSLNKWKLRAVFWLCAIAIGAVAALFSVAGAYTDGLFYKIYQQSPLLAYAITPIGLALIAWITRRYMSGTEGSGIPQIIAALSSGNRKLHTALLSVRIVIGKIFLTCAGLLSGASIGTVGPTIHVGASMMYAVRKYFPVRDLDMHRVLIMAGGAAGISAAFNNPLAGILFAIEELRKSFKDRTHNALLISVVLAGLTSLAILGRYSYFGISSSAIPADISIWPVIIFCAALGGLLGGLFSQMLILGARQIGPFARQYPVRVALICGLLLSLLGFLSSGSIYGTGYLESQRLMSGGEVIPAFSIYKLLATAVSYLSGIPGGIFTPSLSIGAGLGAELAQYFSSIPAETLILIGMVSYFTGVVQTPITAFIIVMGMTNSSSMVLPLMVAALIAKSASYLVCPKPIYHVLADMYLKNKYS